MVAHHPQGVKIGVHFIASQIILVTKSQKQHQGGSNNKLALTISIKRSPDNLFNIVLLLSRPGIQPHFPGKLACTLRNYRIWLLLLKKYKKMCFPFYSKTKAGGGLLVSDVSFHWNPHLLQNPLCSADVMLFSTTEHKAHRWYLEQNTNLLEWHSKSNATNRTNPTNGILITSEQI